MKNIFVIGGGIVGLCTAYFLHKEGCKVTVIDKSSITDGASFVNAGYISPSHIISLASPGMLKLGLQSMFKKDAPFYMKARWDVSFFNWAYQFYKSATYEKVRKAIPVIKDISLLSMDLYNEIMKSEDLGTFYWKKDGLLLLYKTQKAADKEFKTVKIALKEGLEVTNLSREQLLELEPHVHDDVKGGFWYKCDAHSTPNEFMKKMYNFLESSGVTFLCNEKVVDLQVENSKITKVITERSAFEVDELVIAAGSWTGILSKKLNLNIPVQAGKGYSINTYRDVGINYPAVLMESKVAVTPMKGFTRFAGTMEFSGNNNIIRPERVRAIAKAAGSYYVGLELNENELKEAKCGLRPVSPDGLPFIGRPPQLQNLVVAAGHAMMGWSMGPATGKLVCEIIHSKKPSMPIEPFSITRFGKSQ